MCHDLHDHCLRYEAVAQQLNNLQFSVYGVDHMGHGHSSGESGVWDSIEVRIDCALLARRGATANV